MANQMLWDYRVFRSRHLSNMAASLICFGLFGCVSARPCMHAGADIAPDEEAAVLDAIDRFLIAMAARDRTTYASLRTADGMTYSQRLVDGEWRLRRRSNQQDIDLLDAETEPSSEAYWDPTVLIRGPIAVVWAPYEFRIDEKVSHCGVDVFEMLKVDGRWVMGNAMWTVEPNACAELRPGPGSELRPAR